MVENIIWKLVTKSFVKWDNTRYIYLARQNFKPTTYLTKIYIIDFVTIFSHELNSVFEKLSEVVYSLKFITSQFFRQHSLKDIKRAVKKMT